MTKGYKRSFALAVYFFLMFIPLYWMLNMSLRTNADILGNLTLYPRIRRLPITSKSSPIRLGIWATSIPSFTSPSTR